jgi:mono/diheme cytochrome c family protein
MPYGYTTDPELDRSTNRTMTVGVVLLFAMAAAFPAYLAYEPSARESARETQLASLTEEGASIWGFNCASCHGEEGQGGLAPALNSQQFLQSATNDQIQLLVSVGVPGTTMSAYSQDFAGPLTSEQIKAVATYLRAWEDDAPDVPDWRDPDLTDSDGS